MVLVTMNLNPSPRHFGFRSAIYLRQLPLRSRTHSDAPSTPIEMPQRFHEPPEADRTDPSNISPRWLVSRGGLCKGCL